MTFPPPGQQPHPSAQGDAQPYPQARPYPQPYGFPGQFPGPSGPHGQVCEVCGAQPATAVTVRSHQGMVVIMRTVTRRGVFCRTCGLSVYRRMTSDTLVTGWWGILSVFVTPFIVLGNLGARGALRRLPEPYGASRQPLHPGKRVLFRGPAMLILTPIASLLLAIPALVIVGLVVGDGDEPVPLSVGDCVRNTAEWPDQRLEKVGCGSPSAEYRVAEAASCGPGDYLLRAEYLVDAPNPGSCVKRL